jgi:hypothetical protein
MSLPSCTALLVESRLPDMNPIGLSSGQMYAHSMFYTLTALRCVMDEVSDNLKVWIATRLHDSTQRGDSGKSVRQRCARNRQENFQVKKNASVRDGVIAEISTRHFGKKKLNSVVTTPQKSSKPV